MASATVSAGMAPSVGQFGERGHGNEAAVDLEVFTQLSSVVGAAETVGAEHAVAALHVRTDLFGEGSHVVGRGDGGARPVGRQLSLHKGLPALFRGMCSMFHRSVAMPPRRSSVKLERSTRRPRRSSPAPTGRPPR